MSKRLREPENGQQKKLKPIKINSQTLEFLSNLIKNNNREWFTLNRKLYEKSRDNMLELIEFVISELSEIDPHISNLKPMNCMFRINRDVRFSADKSSYKNHFGAHLCMGGKKSGNAGYYVHIQPGQSFVGAGIWQPPTATISTIREHISQDSQLLKEVLEMDSMAIFGKKGIALLDQSDKLKTCPKGYTKDHQEIELLKFKSFTITKEFTDQQVLSGDFAGLVLETLQSLVPFVAVLNEYKS
jgi:uncharacterized protein (TIGR02453 family)